MAHPIQVSQLVARHPELAIGDVGTQRVHKDLILSLTHHLVTPVAEHAVREREVLTITQIRLGFISRHGQVVQSQLLSPLVVKLLHPPETTIAYPPESLEGIGHADIWARVDVPERGEAH